MSSAPRPRPPKPGLLYVDEKPKPKAKKKDKAKAPGESRPVEVKWSDPKPPTIEAKSISLSSYVQPNTAISFDPAALYPTEPLADWEKELLGYSVPQRYMVGSEPPKGPDPLPRPDPSGCGPDCPICSMGAGQSYSSPSGPPRPEPRSMTMVCVNPDCEREKRRLKERMDEAIREKNRAVNEMTDLRNALFGVLEAKFDTNLELIEAVKELRNRAEVAEYERDEYDKECDQLAGAYEDAIKAADYWKALAPSKSA